MNIIFDLDGTLLDARPRMYFLFQSLLTNSHLSFEDYWNLKRSKVSHEEILKNIFSFGNIEIEEFTQEWLRKIELPEWLELDKPYPCVVEYLENLSAKNCLHLVTARQNEKAALKQVTDFGMAGYFHKFIVANNNSKKKLIQDIVVPNIDDWLVGDTGKDIQTGKSLGLKTAAVTSGFLSQEKLSEYSPDIMVENVIELTFENF